MHVRRSITGNAPQFKMRITLSDQMHSSVRSRRSIHLCVLLQVVGRLVGWLVIRATPHSYGHRTPLFHEDPHHHHHRYYRHYHRHVFAEAAQINKF